MKKLSIIIPVYNEEKTLKKIVKNVQNVNLNGIKKEIIIINDCSQDNSHKIISSLVKKYKNIKYFINQKNSGKGFSIRKGLNEFSGNIVVIQDADLEYDPEDFKRLLEPIINDKADVAYGSRMLGHISGFKIKSHFYGNKFLSLLTYLIYGKKVTDMETCYKMMKRDVAKSLNLRANKFNIEPEITAQILKKNYRLMEIPIDYNARSFSEGKKIKWKDGFSAIYTLLKYRFID